MSSNKIRFAVRKFPPFESALAKAWERFREESGCDYELEMVAMDSRELFEATLGEQRGLIGGDWDIAHLNTDWLAHAVMDDAIEDLTPYIAKNPPMEYPNGWSEAMQQMQQFDDKCVGLPFHNGPECMLYRKDLFESSDERQSFKTQYGRELTPPKTWEELIDVAHFFNRPDNGLYGVAIAAYPDGHNTVFDFCLQLWTRGGELQDERGDIVVNSAEAAAGMEYYRRLMSDREAVHPQCTEVDSVGLGDLFARGEAAISINWFGFASMCEVVEESRVKGCVGIANIPAAADGGEPVSLNAYWLYTIAKGSKNSAFAYEFIHFLTRPEQDKALTLEGGIGCRYSTWNDPEINRIIPYYNELSEIHKYSRALPRKLYWSKIESILDRVVMQVINSDRAIVEILNEAQNEVNIVIKEQ